MITNHSNSNLHDLTEKSRTAIHPHVQQHGSKTFYETNDKQCDINIFPDFLLNDMSKMTYSYMYSNCVSALI